MAYVAEMKADTIEFPVKAYTYAVRRNEARRLWTYLLNYVPKNVTMTTTPTYAEVRDTGTESSAVGRSSAFEQFVFIAVWLAAVVFLQ